MGNKLKRTVLALMMVSMLASSVFVVPAFADGDTATVSDTSGDTATTKLPNAVEGVITLASQEYTLSSEVTARIVVPSDVTATINLNGQKISSSSGHVITNNGTLTIKGTGTIDALAHKCAALYNEVGANAILNGGTYTRSAENGISSADNGGNSFYAVLNHGTMEINSGVTVSQSGHYSSLLENGWQNGNENTTQALSQLTINGGKFTGGLNTIKNDDYGDLTIVDGTFENTTQATVLNWNIATIDGGSFTSNSEAVVLNGYINDTMDKGQLTINNGNFSGAETAIKRMTSSGSSGMGTIDINGGTYTDCTNFIQGTSTNNSGTNEISVSNVTNAAGDIILYAGTTEIENSTIVGNIASLGTSTIEVKDSTFRSVSTSDSGKVIVDKDSTVNGNISGNVQVSPLATVNGVNTSTNDTKYTLVIGDKTTENLSWDDVVKAIDDAYIAGYNTVAAESGTTITVTYEKSNYWLDVNGEKTYPEYDELVTITAPIYQNGALFSHWTVVYGNVTLADPYSNTTSFRMPAGHVKIEAVYESYTPVYPTYPDYDTGSTVSKKDGWTDLSAGSVYYKNGVKAKGWQEIDGETYYFDKKGYLQTGWIELEDGWYYLDPVDGAQQTGWEKIGNTWYYMDPKTGVMEDGGMKTIDGETYYFYDWGGMASSWWYLDENTGVWYFFRGNGAMAKNAWVEWKGEYYYCGRDGKMLTSTTTPDGYRVDASGKWIR